MGAYTWTCIMANHKEYIIQRRIYRGDIIQLRVDKNTCLLYKYVYEMIS